MNSPSALTPEQIAILQLLADGDKYSDIALAIGTSEQQIKNRVHLLLQELGADNSRHAIAQAFRAGLLR
jgi:DNA-binding NarL/FixJ family response regulator